MSVLDPSSPWPWILYALAGSGIAWASEPGVLKTVSQLERDTFAAHPGLRAVLLIALWTLWPLIAVAYSLASAVWLWNELLYRAALAYDWLRGRRASKPDGQTEEDA